MEKPGQEYVWVEKEQELLEEMKLMHMTEHEINKYLEVEGQKLSVEQFKAKHGLEQEDQVRKNGAWMEVKVGEKRVEDIFKE